MVIVMVSINILKFNIYFFIYLFSSSLGGATGIAKWRCVFTSINSSDPNQSPATLMAIDSQSDSSIVSNSNKIGMVNTSLDNTTRAMWYPATPDLTQCRSLWLNSLEIRVNQRDSSLISIANDLSQVI